MTVRQKEALLREVCTEARSQIAAPSALLDVTAHYAAPVLYGFGDWLVHTAVSQGTVRLTDTNEKLIEFVLDSVPAPVGAN